LIPSPFDKETPSLPELPETTLEDASKVTALPGETVQATQKRQHLLDLNIFWENGKQNWHCATMGLFKLGFGSIIWFTLRVNSENMWSAHFKQVYHRMNFHVWGLVYMTIGLLFIISSHATKSVKPRFIMSIISAGMATIFTGEYLISNGPTNIHGILWYFLLWMWGLALALMLKLAKESAHD
jgi:hypothetical protein